MYLRIIILFLIFFSNTIAEEISGIPKIIDGDTVHINENKFRLGYGKGYYDRYLNKYLKKYKDILTVGVAFSFQKYHKLPINQKDVKLNFILTEKGIY